MAETITPVLKKTPLHARHCRSNARMVPFGGWEMPVEYSGITAEHMAVRTRAGVFDVSHMGEIEVAGKDALAAVQRISSNDASRLQVGQAHYSALTTFEGTFVDDILVYRMAPNHFMMVVNASNIEKDYAWIAARRSCSHHTIRAILPAPAIATCSWSIDAGRSSKHTSSPLQDRCRRRCWVTCWIISCWTQRRRCALPRRIPRKRISQ